MVIRMPQPQRITQAGIFYDYGALPDSQTVLAHAFGEVTGAMLDFKSEILRAKTTDDALDISMLLSELRGKLSEMEDLALKTADLLAGGSAA